MTDGDTTDDGELQDRSSTDTDDEGEPGADPETAAGGADPETAAGGADPHRSAGDEGDRTSKARRGLLWLALAALSLLAFVALLQFYLNASAAIDRWIAAEYRRIMQAVFNLVVLLCSGIGIALVVRELGD